MVQLGQQFILICHPTRLIDGPKRHPTVPPPSVVGYVVRRASANKRVTLLKPLSLAALAAGGGGGGGDFDVERADKQIGPLLNVQRKVGPHLKRTGSRLGEGKVWWSRISEQASRSRDKILHPRGNHGTKVPARAL